MKTYTRHECERQHRTVRTFLRCAIKRLEWVHGRGDIACIAWCRVPTVQLFTTAEDAENARHMIDTTGCGGRCTGRHDVVRVVIR